MALSEQSDPGFSILARLQLLGRVFAILVTLRGAMIVIQHLRDPDGPVFFGGDFAAFWATAKLVVAGRAAEVFDPAATYPLQYQAIGQDTLLLWHYPSPWTLTVAPFGWLDYPVALAVFQLGSLAVWIWALRRLLPEFDRWTFLAFALGPAVWVSLRQGQNGLLTAALLVVVARGLIHGGWRGPGLAAAALMIKPHLGVLIPVAWLARGTWRAIALTTGLSLAFVGLSSWALGAAFWQAFLANGPSVAAALTGGDLWDQQMTVYSGLARLGVPNTAALAAQGAVAVALILGGWQVFRQRAAPELGAAFLLLAAPLIPPYAFHYDLCASLPALALLLREHRRRPFGRGQGTVLILVFLVPPFHRLASIETGLSLVAPVFMAAAFVIWQRARSQA